MKATMAWVALVGSVVTSVACGNTVEDASGQNQAAIAGAGCAEEGAVASCSGGDGELTCEKQSDGKLAWSSCVLVSETPTPCVVGQTQSCTKKVPDGPNGATVDVPGTQLCEAGANGQPAWSDCTETSGSTPLVLELDGVHATFSNAPGVFDLHPSMSVATDWPSAATPWLALDRDHDGAIGSGGELFGSATALSSGGFATNGFEALSELDSNHDGRIDRQDAMFSSLVVWTDANQNRVSEPSELVSLASLGVESITLSFENARHCDARGNCEVETSTFTYRGANGALREGRIVDLHLQHH